MRALLAVLVAVLLSTLPAAAGETYQAKLGYAGL